MTAALMIAVFIVIAAVTGLENGLVAAMVFVVVSGVMVVVRFVVVTVMAAAVLLVAG